MPTTLQQQNNILKRHFGITIKIPKKLPEQHYEADGLYLLPSWEKIGKDYNDAVMKVLEALKKDRKCYDWREGNWGKTYLRQRTPRVMPEIVSAQLGKKYEGKSVREVREISTGETLLGMYEVGMILLLNPHVLTKYEDLWIDCAGDEYSYYGDGAFSGAPLFGFRDGRVWFGTRDVDFASGYYGAASVFSPQSNLESRPLDTFDSSSLESRVKSLESDMDKIKKFLII